MKIFLTVALLVAAASAQQFKLPLPFFHQDLSKYQGPYAGQYYGEASLGYLGRADPMRSLSQEVPLLTPFSGVLTLDQIVKLPLFHDYLNIPLFKEFFPSQEFQAYLTSPLFQDHWTNPRFQQLFMDSSLFYKYIFPLFNQYNAGKDYFAPTKDMLPPAPMYQIPVFSNKPSYDFVNDLQTYKKPVHPLMTFLIKQQHKKQVPTKIVVTEAFPAPLPTEVTNTDDLLDHLLAEKIVQTVMTNFGPEGPAKKQDPNFRYEDVKLTYDSLMPKEEEARTQDPNFRAEDVKLTYDSIIPKEPESVDKVPEVDPNLVSITEATEEEEKKLEFLNSVKAARASRFDIPGPAVEMKLIGAEEGAINKMTYETTPSEEENHERPARQSSEYRTTGNNGLHVVPLSLNENTWNTYSNAAGQELPVEKLGDEDTFNLS